MALPIEQPAEPEQWRRSADPEPIEFTSIDEPREPFPEPRPLPHVIGRRSPGTRPNRIVEVPPEPEPAPDVWPTLSSGPTSRHASMQRPPSPYRERPHGPASPYREARAEPGSGYREARAEPGSGYREARAEPASPYREAPHGRATPYREAPSAPVAPQRPATPYRPQPDRPASPYRQAPPTEAPAQWQAPSPGWAPSPGLEESYEVAPPPVRPTSRPMRSPRPAPPRHVPPPRPAPRPAERPVQDEPLPELRGWARNNYTLVVALGAVALAAWLVLVVLRTPEQTAAADQMSRVFDDAVADTLRAERTAAFAAWIVNATTTFVLGGYVFRTFIDRRDTRRADWSPAATLRGAAVVATVASLAALPLRAVAVAGMGRAAMVDPEVLRFVATSRFGDAALLRVAGLLMTTFAVVESPFPAEEGEGLSRARRVANGIFGVVGVLLLLGSYAWVGHPQATTAPGPLLVLSQSVHIFAASTWFAGCALLAMQMRSARRYNGSPRTSAQLVARFSTIAGVAVAMVGTSGVALAQSQIASVDALTATPYGRALVVKVMFVAAVVVIGGYNRQRVVPAVVDLDDADGWRWLHRTVLFEAFILVGGVLLATTAMTSGGF